MHKDKLHSRFRFSSRIPSPRDMNSLFASLSLSFFLSLSLSLSLSLYWTVSRELRSCRMEVWMEGRGCPSKTVFDRFIFPQRDLLLRDPLNFAVNVAIEDFFGYSRGKTQLRFANSPTH